ncbi:hypothetical protein [Xenorhabdus ishibashii]|uniref:Uncharacterized protein n=1 Tax=Xenorhabdus ishibashii TaxID=1034471 RepID=A0A2D0K828_9GAMM|nr:hypothetical protein [Xenorhabdus ishibashii]PHM59533.1 hypothetical protein Xish_03652 [Xenorhabdus ishibashii]
MSVFDYEVRGSDKEREDRLSRQNMEKDRQQVKLNFLILKKEKFIQDFMFIMNEWKKIDIMENDIWEESLRSNLDYDFYKKMTKAAIGRRQLVKELIVKFNYRPISCNPKMFSYWYL